MTSMYTSAKETGLHADHWQVKEIAIKSEGIFLLSWRRLCRHCCSPQKSLSAIYYSEKQMCSPGVIGCPFTICFLAEPLINKGVGFTHYGGQASAWLLQMDYKCTRPEILKLLEFRYHCDLFSNIQLFRYFSLGEIWTI